MNPLSELLAGRDRWDGAACTGLWRIFDPGDEKEPDDVHAARVRAAQAICAICPIAAACHATAQNMPAKARSGVWAGIAYDIQGRPIRTNKEIE